jgi:FtsH-binding integral membrane protein
MLKITNIGLKKIDTYLAQNVRCMASFRSNRNNKDISIKYIEPTNKELINSDFGLKQFIRKTYLWTGGGIVGSSGIGILGNEILQANPHLLSSSMPLLVSSIVLAFGGALGIAFTKYSTHKDIITNKSNNHSSHSSHSKPENYEILYSTNSIPRIISYGSLVSGMGLMIVPMCAVFPDALVPAFVASSSVFGGASWYAMTRKVGELEPWGGILYGGLTGLVVVSLVGLGSNLFFGSNWFADEAHLISLYGGIPLFTGLVVYNTHKAIELYKSGDADHLGCSVELYLDFINLLVRFMKIIAKIQSYKD